MFDLGWKVCFEGLPLIATTSAERELFDLGLDLTDIVSVLQFGFKCSRSKRKKGVIEKCLRRGDKLLRVAAVYDYSFFFKREVVLIIHVSMEGLKWSKLAK